MLKRLFNRGERGTSLVEMMVVVAIMGVILSALLSALISGEQSQSRTEALVNNQETVRLALDRMQQDFTEANPVDVLTSTSDYADEVQVELGPNPGTRTIVRWTYDPTAGTLTRDIMSNNTDTATVLSQNTLLTGITNASTSTQMFTYYDAADTNLQTANPSTPANVANCAIRIHIVITAASDPGPLPFTETADAELRNRLPGGIIGCPNG